MKLVFIVILSLQFVACSVNARNSDKLAINSMSLGDYIISNCKEYLSLTKEFRDHFRRSIDNEITLVKRINLYDLSAEQHNECVSQFGAPDLNIVDAREKLERGIDAILWEEGVHLRSIEEIVSSRKPKLDITAREKGRLAQKYFENTGNIFPSAYSRISNRIWRYIASYNVDFQYFWDNDFITVRIETSDVKTGDEDKEIYIKVGVKKGSAIRKKLVTHKYQNSENRYVEKGDIIKIGNILYEDGLIKEETKTNEFTKRIYGYVKIFYVIREIEHEVIGAMKPGIYVNVIYSNGNKTNKGGVTISTQVSFEKGKDNTRLMPIFRAHVPQERNCDGSCERYAFVHFEMAGEDVKYLSEISPKIDWNYFYPEGFSAQDLVDLTQKRSKGKAVTFKPGFSLEDGIEGTIFTF